MYVTCLNKIYFIIQIIDVFTSGYLCRNVQNI